MSNTPVLITLPGELTEAQYPNIKLGPGLLQVSGTSNPTIIRTTRAGSLNRSSNNKRLWVESNSRRYVPAPQEYVVGIVTGRVGEGWRVDIGSAHQASLDGYAFEGATKRNKPTLKVNSLVYARVSLAHKDMDPELECFDAQTRKSEGFGELKDGFLVRCSLRMCRMLLDPAHFLLPLLGSRFQLETAVGLNGRVWVNTKSPKHTIAVVRCIEACDPDGGGKDETGIKRFLGSGACTSYALYRLYHSSALIDHTGSGRDKSFVLDTIVQVMESGL